MMKSLESNQTRKSQYGLGSRITGKTRQREPAKTRSEVREATQAFQTEAYRSPQTGKQQILRRVGGGPCHQSQGDARCSSGKRLVSLSPYFLLRLPKSSYSDLLKFAEPKTRKNGYALANIKLIVSPSSK